MSTKRPNLDAAHVPASPKSVVLGTAGHIDHGKTALVFALTGTDTDRLPEEKRRGITIDLGFASLPLKDASGQAIDMSIIDVPGHHAFVRNMLAGTGGIDCVMLVIAADEGVKPQTEEHLAICSLLGVQRGVVVLTKKDAVSAERLDEAREEVAGLVEKTFLQGAPVLAVSAHTRDGIPELKTELARLAAAVRPRSTDQVLRLPVDRVFSVRGFGTVVTGTLQAGSVCVEDTLELHPGQRSVRVRGVQVHGKAQREAHAPGRVALNLAGLDATDAQRGGTLAPAQTLAPVGVVDAEISMLDGAFALKHRSRVRVHAFTSDALATVLLYEAEPARKGAATLARLRLAKPMLLVPGDRFVIRQASPAVTLGGGRVLDAHPLPRLRKLAARAWLEEVRYAEASQQIWLRVRRRGVTGSTVAQLRAETGLTLEAIERLIGPLLSGGSLIRAGEGTVANEHLITPEGLARGLELCTAELQRTKAQVVSRAELRSRTRLEDWVFELVLARLRREARIEVRAEGIQPAGQKTGGAGHVERLASVEALYAAAGLASPITSEVSATLGIAATELRGIITLLLRSKTLVRMGADTLFIHAGALARLTADLQRHRGEVFDVARFKEFTGLTRKHVIPLLEYLDGARVTRNANGLRTVL